VSTDAASHYDLITDLWKEFMGDNLHFGYFESEDTGLPRAANAMVEKLLEPCAISEESRALDVGCGVGGPAFHIHEKHRCAIDGISTSKRGIEIANRSSKEKGYDKVRFKVADGMNNGFPDNTFDIVWIIEASHPIPDKKALFRECFRVLKSGGTLALCDLVALGSLPFYKSLWRFITNIREYLFAPTVWGPAHILTMGNLCDRMIEAGFARVNAIDVTQNVIPTLRCWREGALRFLDGEAGESSRQYANDFIKGCVNLEKAFSDGLMGYGMLYSNKI
jgi:27-O-demethylrifamycin SV methyltransferase